jgi:hypothetical protein
MALVRPVSGQRVRGLGEGDRFHEKQQRAGRMVASQQRCK